MFRRDPFADLYSVSYLWYTPIAVATVILVGNIVSCLTHPLQPHEIDPKLIIPISELYCCFLPKRRRERLRYGIDNEGKVSDFDYFHSYLKEGLIDWIW